jgi:hypothetical protein
MHCWLNWALALLLLLLLQMLRHQIMKLPSKEDTRRQISSVQEEISKIQQDIASHQHTYQVRGAGRESTAAGTLWSGWSPGAGPQAGAAAARCVRVGWLCAA